MNECVVASIGFVNLQWPHVPEMAPPFAPITVRFGRRLANLTRGASSDKLPWERATTLAVRRASSAP